MEHKIEKSKIEKILEDHVSSSLLKAQNEARDRISTHEKLLEKINEFLPLTTDLLLKHWDILLETAKSFLLISSTILVTVLALDPINIINLDVVFIRKIAVGGLILSIIAVIYILYKRNQEKKKILKEISFLKKMYFELNNIKKEALDMSSHEVREEIKEKTRASLRGDESLKQHLPEDF